MRRRHFVKLVGGAAAWPLAARAQQSVPVVLNIALPAEMAYRAVAFLEGLKQQGYVEGQNVAIEYRWAEGHLERLPALARRGAVCPSRTSQVKSVSVSQEK
jgi:putative tryptophan/tyrosine transport system substrate-binding protein